MIPAMTNNTDAPTANRTASMPRAFKASAREFDHAVSYNKSGEVITKARAISQREDCAGVKTKVCGPENRPETEQRAQGKFVCRDPNVVSENSGRLDLIGFVDLFPPANLRFDSVAHSRADRGEFRKIRIAARGHKAE